MNSPVSVSTSVTRWNRIPPVLLLVLAIASLQVGGALAVGLFHQIGPLATVSLRVGIAAVVLLLANRPRLDSHVRAHLIPLTLFGISIAGMNVCIYEAFARIPMGIAVTLEFAGPLSLAIFLSRRARDFVWAGLAVVGVVLLTPLTGARPDPIGVLLALMAGALWAAYARLGAMVGNLFPGGSGLALGIAIAALVMLPIGFLTAGAALVRPAVFGVGFCIALTSTVIPFTLEFEALRRLSARTYGLLVSLDPAAAAVTGAIILHQPPTPRTCAAAACVVAAAIGVTFAERREAKKP